MRRHRFFLTHPFAGGTVPLGDGDVHHLRDVLRLGPGAVIDVVSPEGDVLEVRIDSVNASAVEATVLRSGSSAPRREVVLCPGVSKGKKMDLVVQKAAELGLTKVAPFVAERSVVRLESAKAKERQERWQRIAVEAAKQCGRADIMTVNVPVTLQGLKPLVAGSARAVVLWEGATRPLRSTLTDVPDGRIALVVGPEGGLSEAEVSALESWGAVAVSLGALLLRTETAAVAAGAIVAYEMGWLGGSD